MPSSSPTVSAISSVWTCTTLAGICRAVRSAPRALASIGSARPGRSKRACTSPLSRAATLLSRFSTRR
uniref:Putative secreted protein n=1 Tax=Anopheles triannulatus TaxID=58253 RepID=A0A2M4B473_9DIPT